MFVAFLFIPVVVGNVFIEESLPNIPEITERQSVWTQGYTIFDPCNTNKPGNRRVSCSQLKRQGHNDDGVYEIYILGKPINVTCDMKSKDGGGWTVIQRQSENENNTSFFERDIKEYESGFGTAGGSFWIGLKNLNALTSFPNNDQALRIELTRFKGQKPTILDYHQFHVGSAKEEYNLTIGDYQNAGRTGYDALSGHNGEKFTVKNSTGAKIEKDPCLNNGILSGGWWFKRCNGANLNGPKLTIVFPGKLLGIIWIIKNEPQSYTYPYHKVEMKIRDADFGFCTGRQKS